MKLFLITLFATLSVYTASAQVVVNEVDINEAGIKYCEIVARQKFLSTKVIILVDYGQPLEWKSPKIRKKDGKAISFQSVIGALNFMEENGWEYVNNYALTEGNANVYHFLMRKKEN
jgi:hypothetical protein